MDPAVLHDSLFIFQKLGIALLLGLLVGLQREYAEHEMPGVRTFPLITLLGAVAALLAIAFGGWVLVAGLFGVAAAMVFPNLVRMQAEKPDPGVTTNVAVLLMYTVGSLLVVGPTGVAVAVGGGVAVLLQFKPEMHGFARRLGEKDLKAIMQFVLITCIILPVLPNQTYGPLSVFNPFKTWLLVVLIVGMSLGGYIVYKFLGRNAGILLGGVLGGVISSTATTVSYARQGRSDAVRRHVAAVVIMIASTVVYGRVMFLIAVVAPGLLPEAAGPMIVLALLTLVPTLVAWYGVRRQPSELPEQKNPTQLKSAILFAAMYAVVLFALAATKDYAGGGALYPVALVSGLTDVDAVTLSISGMVKLGSVKASVGWRLIAAAILANFVFKAICVGVLGSRRLLGRIVLLFALPMVGGVALILLWPL